MKKRFYSFLAFIMCINILNSSVLTINTEAATTVCAGRTEGMRAAVYAYADYEITLRNAVYIEGGADDGKMITDLKYSQAFDYFGMPIDGWVKIGSYDGSTDFRVTVDIDLGFKAAGLNTFYSRNYKNVEKEIGFADEVKFYISSNGEDYEYIGDGVTDTDLNLSETTAIYRLITKKEYTARFVRAVFECNGSNILYINEICAAAEGLVFYGNCTEKDIIRDTQGVIYRISGTEAAVAGLDISEINVNGKIPAVNASFNEDKAVYRLGEGSGNEVTVYCDFIDTDQTNYSGAPNNIKYIVIHNTGTTGESTDAERYNYRLHQSDGTSSWHYTVDDNKIYHSLADSIAGWHAGPTHNYESIGIEMCVNGAPTDYEGNSIFEGQEYNNWVNNRFRLTMKNTAVLTAELLTRYGLGIDAVIQHYDVSEKDCPQWLRANGEDEYNGELWLEFMSYVEEYYLLLNGDSPAPEISRESRIVIPDYIHLQSGEVYPVTALDADAFADMDDYINEIELGSLVNTIGIDCFSGSFGLEKVTLRNYNDDFYNDNNGRLLAVEGNVVFDPDSITMLEPKPAEWCSLDIRELDGRYYIFCKDEEYTVDFIEMDYCAGVRKATDSKGNRLRGNQSVGTGTVICFDDGVRLYVVCRGDADGDSEISITDYILAKRIYFGTYNPTQRQISALALSNGEGVTMTDYIMLKRHYFGTFDIMK